MLFGFGMMSFSGWIYADCGFLVAWRGDIIYVGGLIWEFFGSDLGFG